MSQKITISVIGGHKTTKKVEQLAHKVGKIVAKMGCVLVCGGLDGIMRAASKGAKSKKGMTIGLLPGTQKIDANPFIDVALPTTIGYARNATVAACGDMIIALPGSHGTSSEISYGFVYGRPIFDLGGWNREGMIQVKDLNDLEKKIKALIPKIKKERWIHYRKGKEKSDKDYARTS